MVAFRRNRRYINFPRRPAQQAARCQVHIERLHVSSELVAPRAPELSFDALHGAVDTGLIEVVQYIWRVRKGDANKSASHFSSSQKSRRHLLTVLGVALRKTTRDK